MRRDVVAELDRRQRGGGVTIDSELQILDGIAGHRELVERGDGLVRRGDDIERQRVAGQTGRMRRTGSGRHHPDQEEERPPRATVAGHGVFEDVVCGASW